MTCLDLKVANELVSKYHLHTVARLVAALILAKYIPHNLLARGVCIIAGVLLVYILAVSALRHRTDTRLSHATKLGQWVLLDAAAGRTMDRSLTLPYIRVVSSLSVSSPSQTHHSVESIEHQTSSSNIDALSSESITPVSPPDTGLLLSQASRIDKQKHFRRAVADGEPYKKHNGDTTEASKGIANTEEKKKRKKRGKKKTVLKYQMSSLEDCLEEEAKYDELLIAHDCSRIGPNLLAQAVSVAPTTMESPVYICAQEDTSTDTKAQTPLHTQLAAPNIASTMIDSESIKRSTGEPKSMSAEEPAFDEDVNYKPGQNIAMICSHLDYGISTTSQSDDLPEDELHHPGALSALPTISVDRSYHADVSDDVKETQRNTQKPVTDMSVPDVLATSPSERLIRQFEVPGYLEGALVAAVPDYGSSFDIISEELALGLNLSVDTSTNKGFFLPNGWARAFVGTVALTWSFWSETPRYTRVFHVLANCVHPVMLGRQFLELTDTMKSNTHRIQVKTLRCASNLPRQLFFVDSQDQGDKTARRRFLGLINGYPIGAFADTQSDLTIIKRSVADNLGFPVLSGAQHTTEVQFIDGSTAFTTGIVRGADWCFSASLAARDTHRLDIHVMDDLPCALILDKWMLHDNNAFTEYEDTIIDILHADAKAQNAVCMIMEKRSRDFWNKAKGKAKKLMDNSTVVGKLREI